MQQAVPASEVADNKALALRRMHPDLLAGLAYDGLATLMGVRDEFLDATVTGMLQLQDDMHARNATERMALAQMMLAQGRAAWLTDLATKQTQPKSLAVILEGCERASSTYVKLMRAFYESRQPRSPTTTVSIGVEQANLAAQQVVHIQKQGVQEKPDEQTRIGKEDEIIDAEVVHPVETGTALTESVHKEKQAVDKKHGAKNSGRKGQGSKEPAKTRRKVHHRRNLL